MLPSELLVDVSTQRVDIGPNRVFVKSTALPFLNAPATITLDNLSGTSRVPLVDPEDDGTFHTCGPVRCTLISFSGGTLVFDVTGFTTYSSFAPGPPADPGPPVDPGPPSGIPPGGMQP